MSDAQATLVLLPLTTILRSTMENENGELPPFDLYDSGVRASIAFESESDALFSAFCLSEDRDFLEFPSLTIDAFIGFLKNPHFRADQLTYKSTDDMIDRITRCRRDTVKEKLRRRREEALQRREIALKRPMRNYANILAGNIPRLVLEFVSEELAQSVMLPIRDGTIAGLDQSTLRNACLVHSSWKDTVQHFLGRNVEVKNNAEIYGFLASPLMGPSTRQLCYHFTPDGYYIPSIYKRDTLYDDDYILCDSGEGDDEINEAAHTLSHVLSVCTGIRVLRIDGCLDRLSMGSNPFLFHRIAQLQNLEVLSLGDIFSKNLFGHSDELLDICTVLPNIRKLKSLTLIRFRCPEGQIIPPYLDKLSPPSSLTDVEVRHLIDNKETEVLLSWLFRPREAYSVLSTVLLSYEFVDSHSNPGIMRRVLDLASSSLESITVNLYSNSHSATDMADFLSTCTRLRVVKIINFDGGNDWIGLGWMPSNIEKLHIDAGSRMLYDKYQHIEAGIRKLLNLRSLYIEQDPKNWDEDDQMMQKESVNGLAALKLYCAQSGIEFSRGFLGPIV